MVGFMKYYLTLIGLSLISAPALSDEISRNAGDKSLNFSFSDFAIDNYKYGIGGKYWFSTGIAGTGSINFQNNKLETESTGGTPAQSTEITSYGLSFGIEKHFNADTKLSPYIGGEIYYLDSDADDSGNTESTITEWGIDVLVGAEYALNKSIALAAEYSFGYRNSETKSVTGSDSTTSTNKGFGLGSGELILLLYF
jgi:opacity protein-like surface antigen